MIENDAGGLEIEVLCGGIGMFTVKVALNQDEASLFRENGKEFIEDRAYRIAKDPERYEQRRIS